MVSAADVSADKLIKSTAEKLKKDEVMRPPKWADFVKTGSHVERKPVEKDWWYTRCASILRRADIEGSIGVGTLRTWYGGRKNKGSKPEHHVDAGGSVIRKAVQQLEKAGYLKKEKTGRVISPRGKSLLHKSVLEVKGGAKSGPRGDKTPKTASDTDGRTEEKHDKQASGHKSKSKTVKPKAG